MRVEGGGESLLGGWGLSDLEGESLEAGGGGTVGHSIDRVEV